MPIATTIDVRARMVVLRFLGHITIDDFVQGREAIQNEPGWSPRFAHVFDFTTVASLDLPTSAIRALASKSPVFDRNALQVLVARPRSVEYGLARMFQSYTTDRRNVHIVSSMDEARALVTQHNR